MNHRIISVVIGLAIIAVVVGGVVYWEWPAPPTEQRGASNSAKTATTTALESLPTPTVGPAPAEALSNSAVLWIGLKNSDDQGTNFDLRVELYRNSTLVAAGESRCITGVTRNPDKAKEVSVPLDLDTQVPPGPGDLLSFKVLARIGTNPNGTKCPGHSNAVGLRLYYDVTNRLSRFNATGTSQPSSDYFLHTGNSDFADPTAPTMPPSSTFKGKVKDSSGLNFNNGNAWAAVGTWSVWPTLDATNAIGVTIAYPPGWYVDEQRENAVVFRSVADTIPLDATTRNNVSYFEMTLHRGDNPHGLGIGDWFDVAMRPLISDRIVRVVPEVVDGRAAIRVDLTDVGGRYTHIFVPIEADILEIAYGLYAPQFVATYSAMVASLRSAP